MAGLDPAIQQERVCAPVNLLRPQTLARWMGGSRPPMTRGSETTVGVTALAEAVREGDAIQIGDDAWGAYSEVDVVIRRREMAAAVRTIWIIRTGESSPRLVTCWVV